MSKTNAVAHPKARTVRFGLDEEPARKKAASAPAPEPALTAHPTTPGNPYAIDAKVQPPSRTRPTIPRIEYAIEANIPMPVHGGRGSRVDHMPFRDMRVGDSIFVPGVEPKNAPALCLCMQRRTPDRAYKSRAWPGGARIWRIK